VRGASSLGGTSPHEAAPLSDVLPSGQSLHIAALAAASWGENVFSAQLLQGPLQSCEYVPAGHGPGVQLYETPPPSPS